MKPKSSPHSGAKGTSPPSGAKRVNPRHHAGPSQRQLRVAEEIRHALAEILLRTEFDDKELYGVRLTISEVRMSPDLKHAAIFCTKLGNKDVTPLLPALKRVSPFLRSQLAPKLGLRVTPDLKFLPDQALEEATKINRLLHAPEVARDLEK
jgi:ribosome-binding factor A